MTSPERLSVDVAAERLGIAPDAVGSRIKRGTLWAVRGPGGGQPPTRIPPNRLAPGAAAAPGPRAGGGTRCARVSGGSKAHKINQG